MTGNKKYKKPELEHVKLMAEEAVLSNCKIPHLSGPMTSPGCDLATGPCQEPGS